MSDADMPKNYSVEAQQTFFTGVLAKAMIARFFLFLQSVYFMVISAGFDGADRYMFDVTWLPAGPAFFVAGALGLVVLLVPGSRAVLVTWLLAAGLACIGRQFSIFESDAYDLDYKVRASGWVLQWGLSIVAITQIIGAKALRGRRVWTG